MTTTQVLIVSLSAVAIVAIIAYMKWRIEVDEHESRALQARESLAASVERRRADAERADRQSP